MPILKRKIRLPIDKNFLMSLLSGSEGGLSTTAAIIAGLFVSTDKPDIVVVSAVIAFSVQAFNGAVGRFSAEHTENELEYEKRWAGYKDPLIHSVLQFITHIAMGTLVLLPIILVPSVTRALLYSITITLALLFVIGFYKGKLARKNPFRDALELVILGALVICVGITSGMVLSS